MSGPKFSLEVHIGSLTDQIPQISGDPGIPGLVSTSTEILVAGTPAGPTGDPNTWAHTTIAEWPGAVPVQILVVRHTQTRTVSGTIEERQGHWYWVGGGQEIALAADDPCVTRIWPGGRPMSDHEYATFCTTRIFEPPVSPGIVGTIDFAYDLASEKVGTIRGDVVVVEPFPRPLGRSDNEFRVRRDLSPNGSSFWISVSRLSSRGALQQTSGLFSETRTSKR